MRLCNQSDYYQPINSIQQGIAGTRNKLQGAKRTSYPTKDLSTQKKRQSANARIQGTCIRLMDT